MKFKGSKFYNKTFIGPIYDCISDIDEIYTVQEFFVIKDGAHKGQTFFKDGKTIRVYKDYYEYEDMGLPLKENYPYLIFDKCVHCLTSVNNIFAPEIKTSSPFSNCVFDRVNLLANDNLSKIQINDSKINHFLAYNHLYIVHSEIKFLFSMRNDLIIDFDTKHFKKNYKIKIIGENEYISKLIAKGYKDYIIHIT